MRFECIGYAKSLLPAGKLFKLIFFDQETRQNWAIYTDMAAVDFSLVVEAQEKQFLCRIRGWQRQDKGKIFLRLQQFEVLDSRGAI
jgi:hypothetical protein